jgi:endoglucanase
MQNNAYNVISFQTEAYTESAVLKVTPTPDTLLRVFMTYYPSETEIDIEPQTLEFTERKGFTVVEWGGSVVTNK